MSKSKPCSKCPFRIGSSIGYDLDAVEALDDRDSVVKMWRDAGVACFQVASGDF